MNVQLGKQTGESRYRETKSKWSEPAARQGLWQGGRVLAVWIGLIHKTASCVLSDPWLARPKLIQTDATLISLNHSRRENTCKANKN